MASRQMSLRQYHTLCDLFLQSRCHAGRCGQLGNLDVLTSVPDVKNESFDTGTYVCVATMIGESIRFNSVGLSNTIFDLTFRSKAGSDIWLSQANDIRRRLEVIGKLEDHTEPDVFLFIVDHSHSSPFLVESITFVLGIDDHPTESPPPGYLFLRPSKNFQTGPISFRWPECPAYWSLDPLGTERLTAEEATRLGFPAMQMSTSIEGKFWKAGVYAGLRQFHAAKGFDPDGQDVARHLGYPLHELCSENDAPSVHVEERESLNAVELHVSRWFKVLINVQLTLIFFLLLCQVYEAVTKF
ncbi:hypothetical protein C8R46DRAFT_650586 [Mycena filopes]|nr:hypothetical protein C8R46DRAFT_650586 [Mycena filopes]